MKSSTPKRMNGHPLISIVTPSFNQGRYLRETLQSLVEQNYSNLEVIIQDGGSTDGAVSVAQGFVDLYPKTFQLFVEKDSGQADALNRGFARVRGEILGFLNSDDTLYPGCLQSVAREIDPAKNRYVVMGRCLFTGEESVYVGVEHPASFVNHFEHLAIWKRGHNTIPQPSVFWHRKAWEKCGGFAVNESHVLDYDLFCRFSRRYRFHAIDELWSTYRMHPVSKSSQRTETEILDLSIQVSRRYWGSWLKPLRWRCEFSYWMYQRHNHEKARHHARRCEEAAEEKNRTRALIEFMLTAYRSPKMARDRLLVPFAAAKRLRLLQRLLIDYEGGFTGLYEADLWVGPLYRHDLAVPKNACRLVLILQHAPQGGSHRVVDVVLSVNQNRVIERRFTEPGQYVLEANLQPLQGRRCSIELRSSSFFIPRTFHNVPDDRRLSIQLMETRIETMENEHTDRDGKEGWIGSLYRQELLVSENASRLTITLQHSPKGAEGHNLESTARIDHEAITSKRYSHAGWYRVEVDVEKYRGRACILELRTHTVDASGTIVTDIARDSIKLMSVQIENTLLGFSGFYGGDSYLAPYYYQELIVPPDSVRLVMILQHQHQGSNYRSVNVTLLMNQTIACTAQCTDPGRYTLSADLRGLRDKSCIIELRSDNFFIPHVVHNINDYRQLSIQLIETRVESASDSD